MEKKLHGFFADETPVRSLLHVGYFMGALALVTAFGALFETRTLNGINLWIKPLKFDLAIMIHAFTLAILAQQLAPRARSGWLMGGVTAAFLFSALVENIYITIQAMRGRHSHFNFETSFESIMSASMGIAALILVFLPMLIGGLLLAQRDGNKSGYKLGTIIGTIIGPILTIVLAGYMSFSGSHYVGAPEASDAGGIPVLGWSLTIPDMRPAHFFALHMIQSLPIIGWLADKAAGTISRPVVIVSAIVNTALAIWLFVSALNGQALTDLF